MSWSVVKLPLDLIKEGKFKVRVWASPEEMAKLRDSIRKHGDVINPIPVRKTADGWEALGGHRRLQAAREAGLKWVSVRVFETKSEADAWRIAYQEDALKEPWSPIAKARAFQKMREDGLSLEDIAVIASLSRTRVENYIRLLKLPEDIQEFIDSGRIAPTIADELLRLESIEEVKKMAERVLEEGLTREEVREEVVKMTSKLEMMPEAEKRAVEVEIAVSPAKQKEHFVGKEEGLAEKEVEVEKEAEAEKIAEKIVKEVKKEAFYSAFQCPACNKLLELVCENGEHRLREIRGKVEYGSQMGV